MKPRRFFFLSVLLVCATLSARAAGPSEQQQLVSKALAQFARIFEDPTNGTANGRLVFEEAGGLPQELAEAELKFAVQPPNRVRVEGIVAGQPSVIVRNGETLTVFLGHKNGGIVAGPGVARFASSPKRLDEARFGPIALPIGAAQMGMVGALSDVTEMPAAEFEGERCRVLKATPMQRIRDFLGLPEGTLTLWVRDRDSVPVKLGFGEVMVAFSGMRFDPAWPAAKWAFTPPEGAKMERVATSHIQNFIPAFMETMQVKVPPLGPATGVKKRVASHGEGRLEMHDGTRVLFLKGTPAQMGEQHGMLLKRECQQLVRRVLYGVGVGSSFAKGRWFFNEIEECLARSGKFVDPRYLAEMDALAAASGHEAEEMRMANFFPELFHCSGFALTGSATAGGRIFHGRILDYMRGVGLEQNATVIVHQPDVGHAWVNVGYAGFVGTVTAMNEKQISVGEMGGRGEGSWDGKPMAQLLREVMEKAGTLDEAVAILRDSPRTCEYYYVIADGKSKKAVGVKATSEIFELVGLGESHAQLSTPIEDTVLLSAGDRYAELVKRVQAGFGKFDEAAARELMTKPVCMSSNIHSVLFAPDTLDFWVANADSKNVASHTRYTHYNLTELLKPAPAPNAAGK